MQHHSAWQEEIMRLIIRIPIGTLFNSDDIRIKAHQNQSANPAHPNAWGCVFRQARKDKLIEKTGRYAPSQVPSSNMRAIAEWRRI